MLTDAFYLALRSLWWYRGRAITIVLCLVVTLWLPLTVRLLVHQFRGDILERAESTPLMIGAKGSRIDLVLHGLYFESAAPDDITMEESRYVDDSKLAYAIPLHIRFRTQHIDDTPGVPIVGTTLEYFDFRRHTIRDGDALARLGECVLGSRYAERTGLKPGDRLLSAPRNAFNLAGDYPLKMRVAGILESSHSPDDDAVFVDLKTAWIIEGIGHGHQQLSRESEDQLLESDSETLTANASVLPFTEITDTNESSFHFHGDENMFPISTVIAVPNDRKGQTLLLGRYASVRKESAQCVKPAEVVNELLAMVFRIEELFRLAAVLSAIVTAVLLGLVVFLSVRLRAPEMTTMQRIGCGRGMLGALVGTEVVLMLIAAVVGAVCAAWMTQSLASEWLRQLLF